MACVSIINYTKCSFIQIIRLVLNFSPLLRHKIDYGTETKCSLQLLFKIKYISPLALKNYMLVNFIHSFWLISRHFYFSQQIKQINKLTDHMKTMNFLLIWNNSLTLQSIPQSHRNRSFCSFLPHRIQ